MKTYLILALFSFIFLTGCAHTVPKSEFMKNTPTQVKIGKLPYSNETGLLYDI